MSHSLNQELRQLQSDTGVKKEVHSTPFYTSRFCPVLATAMSVQQPRGKSLWGWITENPLYVVAALVVVPSVLPFLFISIPLLLVGVATALLLYKPSTQSEESKAAAGQDVSTNGTHQDAQKVTAAHRGPGSTAAAALPPVVSMLITLDHASTSMPAPS